MDPISDIASIIALIAAAYQVVDYLSDLKDGGRERMRLLAEVTNFCCALDNLKELLESDSQSSESDEKIDEKWTKAVRPLLLRDGLLEQCNEVVSTLVKRLAPKGGKARLIQHLRWTFTKTEVHEAVEQLHRLQTIINNVLSQISISLSQQIRDDGVISRQILEDREAHDIRNWLSPLDFTAQQEAIFANHCPGTGAQFLQSDEFECWKTADRSTMWCYGVPGAGKTYLSSIVVNELQQKNQALTDAVLVIYCRYDLPECQSISNIAGDLLRQCTRGRQVPKALAELFHSSAGTRPSHAAFFSILSKQMGFYRKSYILVDALDEIAVPGNRRLLLESLRSIHANLSIMIMSRKYEDIETLVGLTNHVCDCCADLECTHCGECPQYVECLYHCGMCDDRYKNGDFPGGFDLCQRCYVSGSRCPWKEEHKLMVRQWNCIAYKVIPDVEDLKRYLQWRMAFDSSLKMLIAKREGLQNQVFNAIVSSSASMFLMAKLIIDVLATCLTVKELKVSLDNIPSGLHVAYNATMQRVIDQGQSRSRRAFDVLKWVLLAKRPLTSAEMEHAVNIEHESNEIDCEDIVPATILASLCAGLVVIDDRGDFRFMHQTVPEYLKKHHSEKFRDADSFLAESCLTYIRYETFAQGPCNDFAALQARRLQSPAYSYCTRYWYQHLIANGALCERQKQAALQFFKSEPHWRSANQEVRVTQTQTSKMPHLGNHTILHHAAFLDASLLFRDLMRLDPACLNRQGSNGYTPLMVTACYGSVKMASQLLEAGAGVDIFADCGRNALHLAVRAKQQDLVELLLSSPRININSVTKKTKNTKGGKNALIAAAQVGLVRAVCRLLQEGAEVNTLDNRGRSALHWAALKNHSQVVDLLIAAPQINIDIRHAGSKEKCGGQSPLITAAGCGNVEIVKSLISAGADLTIMSDIGRTALHVAVRMGHVAVVEVLVNNGMDVDLLEVVSTAGDEIYKGLSAVMLASLNRHVDILNIVLKHSRDINLRSSVNGATALLFAIGSKNIDAVEVLLAQKKIEVDIAADDGRTPLIVAASLGMVSIIQDLVAHGADLNSRTIRGGTPLIQAVWRNHTETAKMVLSFPAIDVDAIASTDGRTALHDAVGWGNAELVEHLILYGANLQIRDKVNRFTPLDYALYFNNKEILRFLKAGYSENGVPSG